MPVRDSRHAPARADLGSCRHTAVISMPLKTDGSRNVLLVFGCELVVVETGRYPSSAVYLFKCSVFELRGTQSLQFLRFQDDVRFLGSQAASD